MTKEERMNSLEIFVKQGKDLTTKELTLAGFSKYDLECLRKDVLIIEERGIYTLKDRKLLYSYGKSLEANSKSEEAIKCYKRCLELDSNFNAATFRLFAFYLKIQDYPEMFKYFDILYLNADELHKRDYNLILLLLASITEIPDKYKDIAANLKLEDVILSDYDYRYDDVENANIARIKIFDKKYKFALNIICEKSGDNNHRTFIYIIQTLLKRNISKTNCAVEEELCNLIKAHDYEGVIDRIKNKKKGDKTFSIEKYLLLLTEQIIAIKANGELPKQMPYSGSYYLEALKRGQYELALTLSEKHNNRINEGYNLFKLLLQDIIKLINERVPISDEKCIAELIKTNKYKELLENLEEKEKAGTLSQSLTYILILVRELLNIRKTGQVSLVIAHNSANIYEAIDNKDFGRALYLSSQNRTGEDNSLFYLILADINYEIEKQQVKKPASDADYLELIKSKNYKELLNILMSKIDKRANSQAEKYLSFLISDLLSIRQSKKKLRTNYGESLSLFSAIENQDYESALNFIKEELSLNSTIINECLYLVLTDILAEIKFIEEKRKINVVDLIKENKYAEIISYYEQKKQDGPISINEEYILRLARDLINIKSNKPVSKIKSFGATTVFEAIDNNDYEKALNLSEKYCQKKGYNKNANPIYLLLDKINAETNTRKPKKKSFVSDLIRSRNYESIIKYYQDKAAVVPLVKVEESILSLCQTIMDVKTNGVVPKMSISSSNSIFNLIDHGDYKKALSMAELYCEQKGIALEEHDLYCLLTDLFAEINKIEEKKAQASSVTSTLILELIKNNEYEKLQNTLKNKKQFRTLDFREEYLLKLAESYLNIKKTGIIPEVLCTNASSTAKAIDGNNYNLALKMLNGLERKGANNSNNSLYLMLEAIVALIEELKRVKVQSTTDEVVINSAEKSPVTSIATTDIVNLIKNKEFAQLRDILNNKKSVLSLNLREKYVLKVVEDYLNIKETGNIPKVRCTSASSTAKAIDGNNYSLALDLIKSLERKGADNSNNILYLMLEEIVSLIEEVKRKSEPVRESQTLANTRFETNNLGEIVTIDMIFSYLSCGKTDFALVLVHKYLEQIGETKYEFLVVQAIKCSILETDLAFIRPMSLLISLKRGTFAFELNKYLEIFYAACENGEVDLAEIYLEIIQKSKEIFPNNIDINWLNNTIQNAKKKSEIRK